MAHRGRRKRCHIQTPLFLKRGILTLSTSSMVVRVLCRYNHHRYKGEKPLMCTPADSCSVHPLTWSTFVCSRQTPHTSHKVTINQQKLFGGPCASWFTSRPIPLTDFARRNNRSTPQLNKNIPRYLKSLGLRTPCRSFLHHLGGCFRCQDRQQRPLIFLRTAP